MEPPVRFELTSTPLLPTASEAAQVQGHWRRRQDSNLRGRGCNPPPSHSDTTPCCGGCPRQAWDVLSDVVGSAPNVEPPGIEPGS